MWEQVKVVAQEASVPFGSGFSLACLESISLEVRSLLTCFPGCPWLPDPSGLGSGCFRSPWASRGLPLSWPLLRGLRLTPAPYSPIVIPYATSYSAAVGWTWARKWDVASWVLRWPS